MPEIIREKRTFAFEMRAEQDEQHGKFIAGRPIVFNQETDLGWYREEIMPGALDACDMRDVRLLVNHNTDMIPLARTRNNTPNSTMQLMPVPEGLDFRANLDTEKNTDASAAYSAVDRGDMSGMSFMFTVDADRWEDLETDHPKRFIERIGKIFEISICTFPAYEGTSVQAASEDSALESAKAALESARAAARAKAEEGKAPEGAEPAKPAFVRCDRAFKDMDSSELTARAAEIESIECPEAAEERAAIEAELEARKAAAARDAEQRKLAADDTNVKTVKDLKEEKKRMSYTVESAEYRSAFLKTLKRNALTEEEGKALEEVRASAYVMTTGDTTHDAAYLVPKQMLNEIWDLMEASNPILADIDMLHTGTAITFGVRKSISQGDAKVVSEATANDDEINEWGEVTLSGKDFSKSLEISYAMAAMSIDALEDFLVKEIADRMGAAIAKDVVTQILTDYDDDNNAVETASVGVTVFKDIAGTMAKLKNKRGNMVVYGSHDTIFNQLVGMVDDNGRPIFQYGANDGPAGYLIGAAVKEQDNITDGVLLIGYPKCFRYNMIQDIMVESDKDIKIHKYIYSGYARGEGKLVAPKAFATLTVQEQD